MAIVLPDNYRPSDSETYMNPVQLEYFRQILVKWKEDLLDETEETFAKMAAEKSSESESLDRGTLEASTSFELRTRDRYRKLMKKIDNALERIQNGTYGYCEETGEPIGIRRLEARPVATLCIKAQEAHEREERMLEGK